MKLIQFTIESLSPGMIQNPLPPVSEKSPKKRQTIRKEAEGRLYRSKSGRMGVPMEMIMSCIAGASQFVKFDDMGNNPRILNLIKFEGDFCDFSGCDGNGEVPWKPFTVMGHLSHLKKGIRITRPRIPKWKISFVVQFDDKRWMSTDRLMELVHVAGDRVGVGDWRPARGGSFGRFKLVKMETMKL